MYSEIWLFYEYSLNNGAKSQSMTDIQSINIDVKIVDVDELMNVIWKHVVETRMNSLMSFLEPLSSWLKYTQN